ncbi:hypothetical protein QFZ23_004732 [Arthrobacter globiformis]|nr:hypothetical protein [Arthrobacter globiformis]
MAVCHRGTYVSERLRYETSYPANKHRGGKILVPFTATEYVRR